MDIFQILSIPCRSLGSCIFRDGGNLAKSSQIVLSYFTGKSLTTQCPSPTAHDSSKTVNQGDGWVGADCRKTERDQN